ncbi:MAG: lysophospholipid acyltransferase family protein [Deltaproteobacteria bacterium]|nr:lysophospholipid acyltransferase family protein [Deltaproteobacteria bacterium]
MALGLPSLGTLRARPRDLARWLFWVPSRRILDPSRPDTVRKLWPGWIAWYAVSSAQRARMADEYVRVFGPALDRFWLGRLLADAARVAWRVHLEELLVGRLDPQNVDLHLDLWGREHLDAALARGRGVVLLSAHAGSFLLPVAWLSLKGYACTQYAARGLPPEHLARAYPGVLPTHRWQARIHEVREASEDRLPASFLPAGAPVREMVRRLARNEIVGLAFDGRLGTRWVRTRLMNREALLSPGPYRLAWKTGAALVPVFCSTPPGDRSVAEVGSPILPDDRDWRTLMHTFVSERADPFLLRHPAEYGTWLAHCRLRNGIDDHPFFVDPAPDDRWRAHPALVPPTPGEPQVV